MIHVEGACLGQRYHAAIRFFSQVRGQVIPLRVEQTSESRRGVIRRPRNRPSADCRSGNNRPGCQGRPLHRGSEAESGQSLTRCRLPVHGHHSNHNGSYTHGEPPRGVPVPLPNILGRRRSQGLSGDAFILGLERFVFAEQPGQLNSGSGQQVLIPFCQGGQDGILRSQASVLLLKLLLFLEAASVPDAGAAMPAAASPTLPVLFHAAVVQGSGAPHRSAFLFVLADVVHQTVAVSRCPT